MAQFSAFAPFGLFDFSDAPSPAEGLYNAMCTQVGAAFDTSEGTYKEAMIFATAIAVGCARATTKRAANQRHAGTAHDKLPSLERDYGITPLANATPDERRAVLVARTLLMRGSREEALATELQALLGDDFVRVRATTSAERLTWPATPDTVGTDPPMGDAIVAGELIDSVLVPDSAGTSRMVRFTPLTDSMPLAGQLLTIEPEVLGGTVAEAVTVTKSYDTRVAGVATSKSGMLRGTVVPAAPNVSAFVEYIADVGSDDFEVGDKIVVQSAAGTEMVTITHINVFDGVGYIGAEFALAHGPEGVINTSPAFVANFKRAHSEGASFSSAMPLWLSTQRELQVIVMTTASRDMETLRKIDEIMGRHCKTTTRWRVVETTDRLTSGPWVVNVGKVGVTALGNAAYTL
jgi:hypothetical protein